MEQKRPQVPKKMQDKMVLWDEACRYLNSAKLKSGEDVATEWKAIRDLFVKMDKESSKSGSGVFNPTGHRRQLIWLNANFLSGNIHHTTARLNIQNFPWDNRDNRETLTSSQKEKDNSQRENINIDNISNVSSCPPSPTPPPPPEIADHSSSVPLRLSRPASTTSHANAATGKYFYCTI